MDPRRPPGSTRPREHVHLGSHPGGKRAGYKHFIAKEIRAATADGPRTPFGRILDTGRNTSWEGHEDYRSTVPRVQQARIVASRTRGFGKAGLRRGIRSSVARLQVEVELRERNSLVAIPSSDFQTLTV